MDRWLIAGRHERLVVIMQCCHPLDTQSHLGAVLPEVLLGILSLFVHFNCLGSVVQLPPDADVCCR